MGSPSNADVVTGDAKVPAKEISTAEWCAIIDHAFFRIKPCLKYVAGFKTLGELLNDKLFDWHGKFRTTDEDMPIFAGTNLNKKTRFVALQEWDLQKDTAKSGHEINWGVLLLTDEGLLVILHLSFFKQPDCNVVCGSSLIANSSAGGHKSVLGTDTPEIRDLITKGLVSPYNLLDRLYLLFYHTVSEREGRLAAMRAARDLLEGMRDRIALQ